MFVTNALNALASPDNFFAESADEVPFWQPALVVVVAAVLTTIQTVLVLQFTFGAVEGVGESAMGVVLVVTGVFGFGLVMVAWVVVAALLHGLSAVAGAERGSLSGTVRDVGWGFLPAVVNGVVGTVATWYALQQISPSLEPTALQAQLQSLTITQISLAVGVLTILWQGVIWTYATHYGRGIELKRAAIVVAVPVGLYLVYTLVQSL